jgi:hypothetical protein
MALVALVFSACYQQPALSPQRPLGCTSSEAKGECPKGYSCIANQVCAPDSCKRNEDCPAGLACTNRGCVIPPDGGGNDGSRIQIPPEAGVDADVTAADAAAFPDAPALADGGQG